MSNNKLHHGSKKIFIYFKNNKPILFNTNKNKLVKHVNKIIQKDCKELFFSHLGYKFYYIYTFNDSKNTTSLFSVLQKFFTNCIQYVCNFISNISLSNSEPQKSKTTEEREEQLEFQTTTEEREEQLEFQTTTEEREEQLESQKEIQNENLNLLILKNKMYETKEINCVYNKRIIEQCLSSYIKLHKDFASYRIYEINF